MPADESETERVRRIYDRRTANGPASRADANMRWLCSRAQGETLEVGIGRGRTLAFYPRGLRLTGIDLSEVALGVAQSRVDALGLNAVLRQGDAEDLPFPDDHFDTVVFAFVLCTIPDDRRAIAEAVRVLREGGRLLLVEHVRSPNRAVRTLERLLDPITVRRQADHLLRDPLEHILAEGLEIETLERSWFGVLERLAARKPDSDELAEAV
jgi:ubiquinone/menaquinone biosynthesis C-methylase UbiE